MATVLYRCPTCGGSLTFDPSTAKYRCESCGQLFEESVLESSEYSAPAGSAAQGQTAGASACIYSCPSCGAQITAEETTSALRCYYCHSPLVFHSKFTDAMRPDAVLPFRIGREQAREEFLKWLKDKKYLPKDFYAPGAIDDLYGVYYPYWVADYTLDAEFYGEGRIIRRTSTATENITTTQIFEVARRGILRYSNIVRSALKKSDRKLADAVFPYPLEGLRQFETGYLSGFMAESRDIESVEVGPDIEREIQGYASSAFSSDPQYTTLSGRTQSSVADARYRYVLLPAWVFTYLGLGKNVYYFIMNGVTGEICGRLPVAKGRLALRSLLYGAAAAVLICLGGWLIW